MTLFLFLFFFLLYPSREAPLGGRGWGEGDGGGDEREILRVEAQRTLFISYSPALLSLSRWCQLVRVLLDLQVSTPPGWRSGGRGRNGRKADFLFLPFVAPLNGERERERREGRKRGLFSPSAPVVRIFSDPSRARKRGLSRSAVFAASSREEREGIEDRGRRAEEGGEKGKRVMSMGG